jgi:hypothetical protein
MQLETQPFEPTEVNDAQERLKLGGEQNLQKLDQDSLPTLDGEISDERKITGIAWVVVVLAVLSSTFLYALDNTIMANVRPNIIASFDRIDMLPWLSISYPMGEIGSNPLWYVLYPAHNVWPNSF